MKESSHIKTKLRSHPCKYRNWRVQDSEQGSGPCLSNVDTGWRDANWKSQMIAKVYTHSVSHAHFSDLFLAWRQDIACTHGSGCSQCACHVSPSHLLPSHVSFTVFATPARSPRHFVPVCTFLAELFPIRERGSSALPHARRGVWLPGRSDALHRL